MMNSAKFYKIAIGVANDYGKWLLSASSYVDADDNDPKDWRGSVESALVDLYDDEEVAWSKACALARWIIQSEEASRVEVTSEKRDQLYVAQTTTVSVASKRRVENSTERLTDEQIDCCRRIGRNEADNNTVISLSQLDALCAEAVQRGFERDATGALVATLRSALNMIATVTEWDREAVVAEAKAALDGTALHPHAARWSGLHAEIKGWEARARKAERERDILGVLMPNTKAAWEKQRDSVADLLAEMARAEIDNSAVCDFDEQRFAEERSAALRKAEARVRAL